jgi:hypothetical protein
MSIFTKMILRKNSIFVTVAKEEVIYGNNNPRKTEGKEYGRARILYYFIRQSFASSSKSMNLSQDFFN